MGGLKAVNSDLNNTAIFHYIIGLLAAVPTVNQKGAIIRRDQRTFNRVHVEKNVRRGP